MLCKKIWSFTRYCLTAHKKGQWKREKQQHKTNPSWFISIPRQRQCGLFRYHGTACSVSSCIQSCL